jgi:hypothetical protein
MRPLALTLATPALLLLACSDGSGGTTTDTAPTTMGGIGNLTLPDDPTGSGSDSTSAPTGSDSDSNTSDPAGTTDSSNPKFDIGLPPDGGLPESDKGCKKVDLLFVIDNSGSMADEQINLVNSFPDFVSAMQTQLVNTESYHVGVVTSDDNDFNGAGCQTYGALVTRTGGANSSNKTCAPYAGGKSWMSEEDDLQAKFACAGQVGTGGSGNEQPMRTMLQAVSPAMNAPDACNDGFIRDDALLIVVLITDEEDDHEVQACQQSPQPGSPGEPDDWFDGLVAVKGIESNIVVLSLIGPVEPKCPALDKCNGGITGAEVSPRIVEFTEKFTNGRIGQICAPSYKEFFLDAISLIDSACNNFIPPG